MSVPNQMFQHALDYLKGWPSPTAVDFVAKLSANVTVPEKVTGGRVVHLNSSHEFELGAAGTQMPIFLIQGASEYDVANPGNGASDPYGWTPVAPVGWMSGLVASGAYELESTEYDTGTTFGPNDILHAPTETQCTAAAGAQLAGLLYKDLGYQSGGGSLALYTNNVCGVVSRGSRINHFRRSVVSFWPVYLPGSA